MTDYGFGKCRDCDEPALVKLNGVSLCLEHYRAGLKSTARNLHEICDELGIEYPAEHVHVVGGPAATDA